MLVLTRKANETIEIGKDVKVIVRYVQGCKVSIAIKAPKGVKILRGELAERLREAA